MKTILFTIFQGIEARNILRTRTYKDLVTQKQVKIVLIFSSKEKMDYYENFRGENVVLDLYEDGRQSFLGDLFSKFKFYLLRTSTIDLKRELTFKQNHSRSSYLWGFVMNRIFARKFFINIFRYLDYAYLGSKDVAAVYAKHKPDAVFLAHLFGDTEASFLREAKRRGIKTIGFINSWDKLTARCILRTLPDWLIVPNHITEREAMNYHYVPKEKLFVSGPPQFDVYKDFFPISRELFYKKYGIDSDKKIILFCTQGKDYYDDDWKSVELLSDFIRKGRFVDKVHVIVRFPPNDNVQKGNMDNISPSDFTFQYPGKRFSAKRGGDWDMDDEDLQCLADTMSHSSIIVSMASTIAIDAAVMNKPDITIGFGEDEPGRFYPSPKYFFKVEHFRNVMKNGGIRMVLDEEDLLRQINIYHRNPEKEGEGRKKIVEEQILFDDGRAGARIANFILDKLSLSK